MSTLCGLCGQAINGNAIIAEDPSAGLETKFYHPGCAQRQRIASSTPGRPTEEAEAT